MPLEGQRRWLEVGEVSRVVDCERRSVKSRDYVGNWPDFSGVPQGLCFVVGGRTRLKVGGS